MTGNRLFTKGLAILPGLLLVSGMLTGCDPAPSTGQAGSLCLAHATPITEIQGDGYYSPLEGTRQVARGVVTSVDSGRGFFIESSTPPRPGQSRALFVADPRLADRARPGQEWTVEGTVEEIGDRRDKLTALTRLDAHAVCSTAVTLPLSKATLPLDNPGREALEGMRLAFVQDLYVSDVYSLYRGVMTLSSGGALRVPTEDSAPGRASKNAARENRERSIDVRAAAGSGPYGAGSRVRELAGVLGHDGREQVLLADDLQVGEVSLPAAVELPEPGHLRVVSANLLNFFNGDGRGGGFPTGRGAETRAEFREQKERTQAAFAALAPDLLAVQELENDGYGRYSAAASMVELLDATGHGPYAVIEPKGGRLGGDVIAVGLFFREEALEPAGPPHTLDSSPFRGLSRQPLAQVFRVRGTGETFLVAVNHLKSKGGCPDDRSDRNSDRGQGCWNPTRTEAVDAQLSWLEGLARASGTEHVLVLGDMNAYRREDPVQRFLSGGFVELVEHRTGLPQYSHRYFGQAGTLDYAFGSPSLARRTGRAGIWHINADWPRNMALPRPWLRMSDHDPVYVDLDFGMRP